MKGSGIPWTKIGTRSGALLAPVIIWQILELLVFPADAFTFRFWEAVTVHRVQLLPGSFYPGVYLEKYSAGDKWPAGPRNKLVRFQSDEAGQRNPPGQLPRFDIVVMGDSNVAGSHLDEPDTIRAQLAHRCNCRVYSYAGALLSMQLFLGEERFGRSPPEWVVYEFRPMSFEAGDLMVYQRCGQSPYPNRSVMARYCSPDERDPPRNAVLDVLAALDLEHDDEVLVLLDRFMKQPAYNFVQSRLRLVQHGGAAAGSQVSPGAGIERSMAALRSYREELRRRGTNLILFIMPHDRFGRVAAWAGRLREEGFVVISIDSASAPGEVLDQWWMDDDSHWREQSVAFSAQLIWQTIRGQRDS